MDTRRSSGRSRTPSNARPNRMEVGAKAKQGMGGSQKTPRRRIPPTEQQVREELLGANRGRVAGGVIARPGV
jgi:hypothetical protein